MNVVLPKIVHPAASNLELMNGRILAPLVEALHENRRIQARREIKRYRYLFADDALQLAEEQWPAAGRIASRSAGSAMSFAIFTLCMIWLAAGESDGMPAMWAIFAASLISSTAGFAFSALSGAALFHLVPSPGRGVEIMLICSVANQAMMTWSMRNHIVWRTVARYASGGVIGVLLGIGMARTMASSSYVLLAACFLICYGSYTLFVRTPRLPDLPPALDAVVGMLSGFFGGILAFPSVIVVIWTGCKSIDTQAQRAIYQPFILLMQIVAIFALLIASQVRPGSSHFVFTDLLYMPVALFGTSIGLRLFSQVTEGQFKAAVSAMLIVSGTALLF
jgi:uncharacterized membrane protein YfcA